MLIAEIHDAETQLSILIRKALAGEQVVIAEAGEPLVELRPCPPRRCSQGARRKGGLWKGRIRMAEDFDEPLPDIEDTIYEAS